MFRFACSVALWGGRGAADKYHWHVWGALSVLRPHWVCPHSWRVCFLCSHCSGSRLLYRERAQSCLHFPGPSRSGSGLQVLHKGPDSVGPAFCAFPSPSSSGHQELDRRTLPGCSEPHPLRGPSLKLPRMLVQCILCLFWGAGLQLRPSRQMSTIQNVRKSLVRNWKPVCSLVEHAIPGAEFAPFPSPLPPASGGGWASQQLAGIALELLLWNCSVLPLFCQRARSVFRLVNFLCLSSYPTV